jgi:multiple sugar transport system substrate-binding protein
MNRKSVWTLVTLALIAAVVLGACAPAAAPATQAPAPAQPAQPTAAAQPAATTAPAAETVELRWRTRPDNKEEAAVYASISDDLAKQLGYKLTYEPGGSETSSYQDVLKTEIGAGTAPDVFWIPGTDTADFATRGLTLNLYDMAVKDGFDPAAFYPGPMYHLTYNPANGQSGKDSGALWGLPRDVSTFVLYLNLDLLDEAGAPDPRELAKEGKWDWNAFLEVAQKVRALGSDIYGYGASAWWGPYGVWLNAAGGGFFNADRTACALNTPEALKGLEFQANLYKSGTDVAVAYGEDPEPLFRAGKVAMFQNGRWATPGIRQVKFNWDVVELPNGPSGTPGNWLFWGSYAVNAKTKHPAEAWKLVQALTQADTQGKVAALGANIPSRVSKEALDTFLTFTPPANNQAFLNGIADKAKPTAEGPLWAGSWPEYDAIVGPAVQAVLTGKQTVADFGKTICDQANKVFKK